MLGSFLATVISLTCHSYQQAKIIVWLPLHRLPTGFLSSLTCHVKPLKRQIGSLVNSLSTRPWLGAFEGCSWLMMSVFAVPQPGALFLTQLPGWWEAVLKPWAWRSRGVHAPAPCSTRLLVQGALGSGGGGWVPWAHLLCSLSSCLCANSP